MMEHDEMFRAESEANRERKANGETSEPPAQSDKPTPETWGDAAIALAQFKLRQLVDARKAGKLTHQEFDKQVDEIKLAGELIAQAADAAFVKYLHEGGEHPDFADDPDPEPLKGTFVGTGDVLFHPNAVRFMREGLLVAAILVSEELVDLPGDASGLDAWKMFSAAAIIARALDKVVEGEDLVDFQIDKVHLNDPAKRVRNPEWKDA